LECNPVGNKSEHADPFSVGFGWLVFGSFWGKNSLSIKNTLAMNNFQDMWFI
jgi:hypothetical protein